MNRETLKSLLFVMRLQYRNAKRYLVWTVLYSLYDGIGSVVTIYAGAKFISSLTAVAFQRGATESVYRWLVVLFVLEMVQVIIAPINRIFEQRVRQFAEININNMLIEKMYQLSQPQFDDEAFNTKMARARDGVGSIWFFASQISMSLSNLVRFVGSVGSLMFVSPVVGIVIVGVSIPVTLLRAKQNNEQEATNRKMEPIDRVAFRTRWYLIDPNFMPEIRVMSAYKNLLEHWQKNARKAQDMFFLTTVRMAKYDTASSIIEPTISFAATLYFVRLLLNGVIGLDRFIFLRGLLTQASQSATAMINNFQQMHETLISLNNFTEIYKTEPQILNGSIKVTAPLSIEFKDVSFMYPGTKKLALKNISFVIFPGSRLALVGENGAGKSSLIKLLLRQYLPTSGTILVNGHDIRDINQESYLAAISNLSQEFFMITHLTIKDNLTLGIDGIVADKDIKLAAQLAGANEFIDKLPHKYDQRMDSSFEDGSGLSGGQMQRVGVARALLRDGDVMILDEPTSAIDAKAEFKIFNNIYEHHNNKTTLIVSHRFSTVRKADKIIVMEKGKITEYGSHEELLKHNGLYKEMFEAQAEGYR